MLDWLTTEVPVPRWAILLTGVIVFLALNHLSMKIRMRSGTSGTEGPKRPNAG